MEPLKLLSLLTAGLLAGFSAGLFGIGGGVILVPVFWLLFKGFGVEPDLSIKLSVATSLSVIAITTLFTSLSHLIKGTVYLREFFKLSLFSLPGVALGVWLAKLLPALTLKKLFGVLLVGLGIRNLKGNLKRVRVEGGENLIPVSVFTSALLSSLFGIGGGVVINSILFSFSLLSVERVVAIASLSSFLNALIGTAFYMGVPVETELKYQIGYVYVPATLLVSIGSVVGSRLGLKALRSLSQSHLKRAFGAFMVILGLKILV